MNLKSIYNKYYKGNLKNDNITHEVINFVSNDNNVEKLMELNDVYGIQPALAFLCMKINSNNDNIYSVLYKNNNYKKYFGTLFGAVFYEMGYSKKRNTKPIYLNNAKYYIKNK